MGDELHVPAPGTGGGADDIETPRSIEVFVLIDLVGACAGAVFVAVANGLIVRSSLLWLVLAALVVLIVSLLEARRQLMLGRLFGPLLLVTGGNWFVALVVAFALPSLWPAMILTVLMPLVLSTPYLDRRSMPRALVPGAIMAGLVAAAGLLNDDGGAVPDLDDTIDFFLVIGSLMAMSVPIGLIVWQNNRLQQDHLDRATDLNVELFGIQRQLAESRRRVVEAADAERLRIERDIHDGAQQRLVALGVRLRLLETQVGEDPAIGPVIAQSIVELEDAVDELRELAHGIYPPLLQSRGLPDALAAVARRSPVPVTLEVAPVGRLDRSVETALYFTALEALTNAVKHADGSEVNLSLVRRDSSIVLRVADDGPGFDPAVVVPSRGTHNMVDRLAAVDGEVAITSSAGRGTVVEATVPLAAPTTG